MSESASSAPSTPAPIASDADVAAAIARIGSIDRGLEKIKTDLSTAVAAAQTKAETAAKPLDEERAALAASIEAYCVGDRARLTRNGEVKTVGFPTGSVSWRMGKASVEWEKADEPKIIAKLQSVRGFKRFLKTVVSVSKSKILAATEQELGSLKRFAWLTFKDATEGFAIAPIEGALAEKPPAEAQADS